MPLPCGEQVENKMILTTSEPLEKGKEQLAGEID